eukprot:gene5804-11710_t
MLVLVTFCIIALWLGEVQSFNGIFSSKLPRGHFSLLASTEKSILGKADLIENLADKTGLKKKDIEALVEAFALTIKEQVLDGGKELRLRDFGTFKLKVSSPRNGRNPKTGASIQIAGSKSVAFTASATMKVKDEAESV